MNARIVAVVALLYAVLIGASVYAWHYLSPEKQKPTLATPGQSNYYVDHPVAYRFDRNGRLKYRMNATRSLHYPDDSISITRPDLHYFAGGPGQWHITADHGHVPPDNNRILLKRNVHAHHTVPDAGDTDVTTRRAWVYPDRKIVTSRAHVVADKPTQRVVGDGMRLDLASNQLKVLKNAHVTYKK